MGGKIVEGKIGEKKNSAECFKTVNTIPILGRKKHHAEDN